MLAITRDRMIRTTSLRQILPLELVKRVWGFVAELERGTVEWLAVRLQSLRRGRNQRGFRLMNRRAHSAFRGPFWYDIPMSTTARIATRYRGNSYSDDLYERNPNSIESAMHRFLLLDRYARVAPYTASNPLADWNNNFGTWDYNVWNSQPRWYDPEARRDYTSWVAEKYTKLRIWLRRFRGGVIALQNRRIWNSQL